MINNKARRERMRKAEDGKDFSAVFQISGRLI